MMVEVPKGEKQIREVMARLLDHPFVRDNTRRARAAKERGDELSPTNTEPWQAIGEKYTAASLCFGSLLADGRAILSWASNEHRRQQIHPGREGVRIATAQTYLWREAMRDLAIAAPLPTHKIARDLLPHPAMFWSWETAHGDDNRLTDWLGLFEAGDQIDLIWNATEQGGDDVRIVLCRGTIRFGQVWPTDFADDRRGMIEIVLKLCAFLKSAVTEAKPERLPRAQRRELQREERPEEPVSVVKLRRRYGREGDGAEGRDVEWKHQWWVTGHYRAQWYPSLNAHKVIWLAPYVKGPRDKPLLEHVYSVER
jgi:hypothetical protein